MRVATMVSVAVCDLARHPISWPSWAGRMSSMSPEDRKLQHTLKIPKHAGKTGHVGRSCRYFGTARPVSASGQR